MGSIRYYIDRAASPEAIYARYWGEVALISSDSVNAQDEKALSTTLLITPNFGLRNREFFEVCFVVGTGGDGSGVCVVCCMRFSSCFVIPSPSLSLTRSIILIPFPQHYHRHRHRHQTFSNTLTQPLEALALEEEVQLVFFHPEWVFRDGVRALSFVVFVCSDFLCLVVCRDGYVFLADGCTQPTPSSTPYRKPQADRMGGDAAANYARRSPWPMINILRTPQVGRWVGEVVRQWRYFDVVTCLAGWCQGPRNEERI